MKLIFCMEINIKVSDKLISTLWYQSSYELILPLLMSIIKHSEGTQSNNCNIFILTIKEKLQSNTRTYSNKIWLELIFLVCLLNQLSCIHSIVTYYIKNALKNDLSDPTSLNNFTYGCVVEQHWS